MNRCGRWSAENLCEERAAGYSSWRNFSMVKPGVFHDPAHGDGIDWIVSRNGEEVHSVRHDNMFSLSDDTKPCFLQCPDSMLMVHSGQLRHSYTNTSTSRTSASGVA